MGKGKIAIDVMNVLKGHNRHLSAHGIIQALVGKKFRRSKGLSTAKYIAKMMMLLVGHNGIVGKRREYGTTRFTEYWYDPQMELSHNTVDFGRLIHARHNRETR